MLAAHWVLSTQIFLSTLSLRRATFCSRFLFLLFLYFYPRSPCGERRQSSAKSTPAKEYFYPRSPCGERRGISSKTAEIANFYPRSPCGERLLAAHWVLSTQIFLSTLSLRRATISINKIPYQRQIFLSTLSLRRATRQVLFCTAQHIYFYPRSPCGERRRF